MKVLYYLALFTLIIAGCSSTKQKPNRDDYSEAIVTKNPTKDYLSISCHGKNNSMQACINAANMECPGGWYVTTFINDDTGTLEKIRKSQAETKNIGGIVTASTGASGRNMIVFCRIPEEKPLKVDLSTIPDININFTRSETK